jgi:hypothetical protein
MAALNNNNKEKEDGNLIAPLHLSVVSLCSCSLSYPLASSLLDIFVLDYDDENNSN